MIVTEVELEYGMVRKQYEDIEAQYLNFVPGIRVLPAPFYDEPNLKFTLKRKYEAGAPGFPHGGFEVYGPSGETRAYNLNQMIVHPFELGQIRYFQKTTTQEKRQEIIDPNAPKRKRGRPAKPESERKTPVHYVPTGGKRGRPKSENTVAKAPYVPTGGKRGRPANPNRVPKAPYVPTGGKRGRPKKQTS
jgi:hypothetical protein